MKFQWFISRSFQLYNYEAYYLVGNIYENGEGIEIDYSKAMEYYKKGEEMGDPQAIEAIESLKQKMDS